MDHVENNSRPHFHVSYTLKPNPREWTVLRNSRECRIVSENTQRFTERVRLFLLLAPPPLCTMSSHSSLPLSSDRILFECTTRHPLTSQKSTTMNPNPLSYQRAKTPRGPSPKHPTPTHPRTVQSLVSPPESSLPRVRQFRLLNMT